MYVYIYVCMHACIYIYICINVYIYIYLCKLMFSFVDIRIYTYIYIHRVIFYNICIYFFYVYINITMYVYIYIFVFVYLTCCNGVLCPTISICVFVCLIHNSGYSVSLPILWGCPINIFFKISFSYEFIFCFVDSYLVWSRVVSFLMFPTDLAYPTHHLFHCWFCPV